MSDGIYKALSYLFGAFVLFTCYGTAKDYGEKSTNLIKSMMSGLLVALVIAFFANISLGSHSENCDPDPIYGRCDSIQDYIPTSKQYTDNFFFWLLIIVTPITMGLYTGYKEKGMTANSNIDKLPLDIQTANTIIHEYGRILELASSQIMTKYPSVKYPISLLPYSKDEISRSITYALLLLDKKDPSTEKDIELLKSCLGMLDFFIPDDEANQANDSLLKNKTFQAIAKKHKV